MLLLLLPLLLLLVLPLRLQLSQCAQVLRRTGIGLAGWRCPASKPVMRGFQSTRSYPPCLLPCPPPWLPLPAPACSTCTASSPGGVSLPAPLSCPAPACSTCTAS